MLSMYGLNLFLRTAVLKSGKYFPLLQIAKNFHRPLKSVSATGGPFACICDSKPPVDRVGIGEGDRER